MDFKNLLLESKESIALLTINREKKLNALNIETISELGTAFDYLNKQNDIKGIILTGKGEKAFVAGADIAEFKDFSSVEGKAMAEKGHEVFNKIENLSKPVVAAVHGFALGGGCELAMACHLRVATHQATFGQPEPALGIIPGYGGTQRLTRLIGRTKALEYLLSGENISASQAENLGLVNMVTDPQNLIKAAQDLLKPIMAKSPVAVANIIKCVNAYESGNGWDKEIQLFGASFDTDDFKEGTSAFIEKRKPRFTGQ
jgi:enoyl-CoA hydratase